MSHKIMLLYGELKKMADYKKTLTNSSYEVQLRIIELSYNNNTNKTTTRIQAWINKLNGSGYWSNEKSLNYNLKYNGINYINGYTSYDFTESNYITLFDKVDSWTLDATGNRTVNFSLSINDNNIGNASFDWSYKFTFHPRQRPKITSITHTPTNNPNKISEIVKGHTKIRVNVSAIAYNNATIKDIKIAYYSIVQGNNSIFNAFNQKGNNTLKITVTDSNGLSITQNYNVFVTDYEHPSISIIAKRCDVSGHLSNTGSYLYITPIFSFTSLNEKNIITKKISCNNAEKTDFENNKPFILNAVLSKNLTYKVTAEIKDSFNDTKTITVDIPSEKVLMACDDKNGDSLAIGGYPTRKGFEVFMDMYYKGMKAFEPEIIENQNGKAYKYPDGRLECRISKTFNGQGLQKWGSMYYTSLGKWTYPVPFTEVPSVNITGSRYVIYTLNTGGTPSECGNVVATTIDNTTDYNSNYLITAMGRWK